MAGWGSGVETGLRLWISQALPRPSAWMLSLLFPLPPPTVSSCLNPTHLSVLSSKTLLPFLDVSVFPQLDAIFFPFQSLGMSISHCITILWQCPTHTHTYRILLLNVTFPEAGNLLIKLMQQISNFWHPPHHSPDRTWYINICWIELKENELNTCNHMLVP